MVGFGVGSVSNVCAQIGESHAAHAHADMPQQHTLGHVGPGEDAAAGVRLLVLGAALPVQVHGLVQVLLLAWWVGLVG